MLCFYVVLGGLSPGPHTCVAATTSPSLGVFLFRVLPRDVACTRPCNLPVRTLRDSVVTVRCHPGSRTLTPSLPGPRGCLSTVFQHGILNRRVQQQTGGRWPQLKGISPCWVAVESKKFIIIACFKSAQDGDLRKVFKTSWPLATPHPTPNSLKPLQSPESGTLSALGPGL